MSNTEHLNVYPSADQAARWRDQAEEWDMGESEFIKSAVEAGLKKFDATAGTPDAGERVAELADQRDQERRRNDELTAKLRACQDRRAAGEFGHLQDAMAAADGLTFDQAVSVLRATTPGRVERLLADMEGESVRVEVGEGDEGIRRYSLADPADAPGVLDAERVLTAVESGAGEDGDGEGV